MAENEQMAKKNIRLDGHRNEPVGCSKFYWMTGF